MRIYTVVVSARIEDNATILKTEFTNLTGQSIQHEQALDYYKLVQTTRDTLRQIILETLTNSYHLVIKEGLEELRVPHK